MEKKKHPNDIFDEPPEYWESETNKIFLEKCKDALLTFKTYFTGELPLLKEFVELCIEDGIAKSHLEFYRRYNVTKDCFGLNACPENPTILEIWPEKYKAYYDE